MGIVKSQNGILSIDCDYVGIRVQGNTVVVEQLGIRLGQRHAEHSAALAYIINETGGRNHEEELREADCGSREVSV